MVSLVKIGTVLQLTHSPSSLSFNSPSCGPKPTIYILVSTLCGVVVRADCENVFSSLLSPVVLVLFSSLIERACALESGFCSDDSSGLPSDSMAKTLSFQCRAQIPIQELDPTGCSLEFALPQLKDLAYYNEDQ